MKTNKIKYEGEINLVGAKIPCYVLENGTRILSVQGTQEVLKKLGAGYSNQKSTAWYNQYLEQKVRILFTHNEKKNKKHVPIAGFEATILEELFDTYLKAIKNEIKLSPKLRIIVEQHEMVLRTFAKVGIIALVDEATGYRQVRENFELQRVLKTYTLSAKAFKLISENKEEFFKHLGENYLFTDSKTTNKDDFDKVLKVLLNTVPRKRKKINSELL